MPMITHIALLRGINVGGKNVLPMQELRELLTGNGFQNVRTYIQSGNVVFESAEKEPAALAQTIQNAIRTKYDFEPVTMVLSPQELSDALDRNPFAGRDAAANTIHIYFLDSEPDSHSVQNALDLATNDEECALIGSVFYLLAPNGIGRSKLAAQVERVLGVQATARNLRTATKILELV